MGMRNPELIFDQVGHFGRFQIFLYLICGYQNMSCGIHYWSSVFMSATPKHVCKPPGKVQRAMFQNFSSKRLEDVLPLSLGQKDQITVDLEDGEVWDLTRCSRIWRKNMSRLDYEYGGYKRAIPCSDGYVYDQTKWRSNAVTRWNLVCDQGWFAKLIQPFFMFGVLLGAISFTYISDRIGRRLVLWLTSIGIFLFGVMSAFTLDYYSFMASRFFLAMTSSGYHMVVFVYVMEFIGMKSRTCTSIHLHTFFAFGTMIVAFIGYVIKTSWLYQMILSTVTVPFILCCWMLPETPFWLLSKGRYEEAQKLVDIMASWNQVSSCNLSELLSLDPNCPVEVKKHSLLDLFSDCSIAARTLIIWFLWFTCCLGYYLFTLDTVKLEGNEFINLFLVGVVEIPAFVFVSIGSKRIGRKATLIVSFLSAALVCSVFVVIPKDSNVGVLVSLMAIKFSIGSAFGLVYLYTAELYPTVIRATAMGSSSMISRVASILVPFLTQFTRMWIFLPQLLVGIMTLLSGLLLLKLPDTLGKPLTLDWEDTKQPVPESSSSSSKLLPTTDNIGLESTKVIAFKDSGKAA